MKFRALLFLALGALAASCDGWEVSSENQKGAGGGGTIEAQALGGPQGPQTLLQRIGNARQVTLFQGVRRVEIFFGEGATQRHVISREKVSADGNGAFAIELLDTIQPPMNANQQSLARSLHSLRQGMSWRYRDFSINAQGLFLQNYRAADTGVTATIAGRTTIELQIERLDGSGSIYSVMVDGLTGLVLKSRETSPEGALISEMTYESLDLAPDLSGVAWHQSVNNEQALPSFGRLESTVGFEFKAPRTLPAGFQLVERSSVLDPQDRSTWVKATYSDGVESLFFLHGGPIVADNGIKSGAPLIGGDLVEVTAAVPWTIARGNLRAQRVMALGKVGEVELLGMLRSAME